MLGQNRLLAVHGDLDLVDWNGGMVINWIAIFDWFWFTMNPSEQRPPVNKDLPNFNE